MEVLVNMKDPLVSVVMATFNDPSEYLTISINSILNQSFTDFELLIMDDSTSESTKSLLDAISAKDHRVKIVRKSVSMGFVPALNLGLRMAKGKFIARMDGDDISAQNRLEKQICFLNTHPEISVVGSRVDIINELGMITSHIRFPVSSGFYFRLFAVFRCPIQHGAVLFRRELLDQGIQYNENFKRSEDLELWLRLLKLNYKMINLPDILFQFRIEEGYAVKRSSEHFKYNLKARTENFTVKYALTGLMGIFISKLYSLIPLTLKKKIYDILNNQLVT